jgi:hypothetical protein
MIKNLSKKKPLYWAGVKPNTEEKTYVFILPNHICLTGDLLWTS